jgi:1-acyl-sn-glycerol-3-phosphate acyltransferase
LLKGEWGGRAGAFCTQIKKSSTCQKQPSHHQNHQNQTKKQKQSLAVMFAFPMFMVPVAMMRGCIVFRRDRVTDKDAFNAWVDERVAASPQAGLLVYPEGHRSTRAAPLPLKRGMLHYAYGRRMPVQIIVSLNKESVVNERTKAVRFGAAVVTSYSPVIKATDYADFAGFMAAVQAAWDHEWRATMGARGEGEGG